GGGDPAQVGRGATIATSGLPDSGVPACLSCHDGPPDSPYPRLAGQYARYLEQQLQVFRNGLRDGTAHGRIMTAIAQRLTATQSADVAAYLQSLPGQPA